MKKSLIACALALSSLPLVAAHAEPAALDGRATIDFLDVTYGDLNLARPAGAEVLYKRIKFAATRVCGGTPDIREIREHRQFKTCVRVAANDAVQQVDAPLLTALFVKDEEIEYSTASRW